AIHDHLPDGVCDGAAQIRPVDGRGILHTVYSMQIRRLCQSQALESRQCRTRRGWRYLSGGGTPLFGSLESAFPYGVLGVGVLQELRPFQGSSLPSVRVRFAELLITGSPPSRMRPPDSPSIMRWADDVVTCTYDPGSTRSRRSGCTSRGDCGTGDRSRR